MKKEWFILAAAVVVINIVCAIRPELKMVRERAKTDWPPWEDTRDPGSDRPAITATSGFRGRELYYGTESGRTSYYQNDERRSGTTPYAVPLKLKVDWQYANLNIGVHGASKATPVIDETGIYVGGDSAWFYAFNHDGSVRWKFHMENDLRGVHSTAVLWRGFVCIGGYNGTFYCLDKKEGHVVWSLSVPRGGFGSSPMVIGDTLVTAIETSNPVNAFVARINLADGHVMWQSEWLGEQAHSSVAYDSSSNTLYVGANNNLFYALDLQTGKVYDRIDLGGPVKDTPLIGKKCVLVTSWSRKLFCYERKTGALLWMAALEGKSQSSPTLIPNTSTVVLGDSAGNIYGFDENDGRLIWRHVTNLPIKASALAARLPGTETWVAWVACGSKGLCALDAKTGRVLGEVGLPGDLSGMPAAYEGSLYLALDFPGGLVRLVPDGAK